MKKGKRGIGVSVSSCYVTLCFRPAIPYFGFVIFTQDDFFFAYWMQRVLVNKNIKKMILLIGMSNEFFFLFWTIEFQLLVLLFFHLRIICRCLFFTGALTIDWRRLNNFRSNFENVFVKQRRVRPCRWIAERRIIFWPRSSSIDLVISRWRFDMIWIDLYSCFSFFLRV